jgi:hypothetical protein
MTISTEDNKPAEVSTVAAAVAAVIADYQAELKALWEWHMVNTDSGVLCEIPCTDVRIKPYFAAVYTDKKYCDCPGSEVGKIKDPSEHLPTCRFSKKVKSVNIPVPRDTETLDGYSLGWLNNGSS